MAQNETQKMEIDESSETGNQSEDQVVEYLYTLKWEHIQ